MVLISKQTPTRYAHTLLLATLMGNNSSTVNKIIVCFTDYDLIVMVFNGFACLKRFRPVADAEGVIRGTNARCW